MTVTSALTCRADRIFQGGKDLLYRDIRDRTIYVCVVYCVQLLPAKRQQAVNTADSSSQILAW